MPDEPRLIQEAIHGAAPAFEELISPYLVQLRRWLGYMLDDEAEDCLQEVLLITWLKLPSLNDPCRFRGWLFQLTRNKILDFLRRRKRKKQNEIPLELTDGILSRQSAFQASLDLDEWSRVLTNAERATLWLHYIEGLSIEQIARQRNVSPGTVKRLLHNGRNRIRKNYPQS